MNFDEYMKKFFEFEKDNDLINLKYQDVFVWILVRNRVHSNIANKLGITDEHSFTVAQGKMKKIQNMLQYLYTAAKNIFTRIPKADILIFNHPRKVLKDGVYIDIYTNWYEEKVKNAAEKYLVIDTPLNWHKHLISLDSNHRAINNFGVIKKIITKFYYRTQLPEEFDRISKKLIEEFGYDGNFKAEVSAQYHAFKIDEKYYEKLIKKTEVKKIIYVVKNSFHPLIAASQRLNVPIWEIQHGVMGKYHMMYSYEGYDEVPYFPNGMFLMSEMWLDKTPMPLTKKNVDYYATEATQSKKTYTPVKGQVVILSQPTFSKNLITFLENNIKTNFTFVYKLHPSECSIWKEKYPLLLELANENKNIKVVDDFKESLFEILNKSEYLVGVNSTSILEGIYFGVTPFILDGLGSSLITNLLEENSYELVDETETVDFIEKSMNIEKEKPSRIFYEKNN